MSSLVLYVPGAIVLLLVFLALYDATPGQQASS